MTIILVEIVRITSDAFWSEKLTFVSATFHRSRRGFAPKANVAAMGRPKMAYLDIEKNRKNNSSQR